MDFLSDISTHLKINKRQNKTEKKKGGGEDNNCKTSGTYKYLPSHLSNNSVLRCVLKTENQVFYKKICIYLISGKEDWRVVWCLFHHMIGKGHGSGGNGLSLVLYTIFFSIFLQNCNGTFVDSFFPRSLPLNLPRSFAAGKKVPVAKRENTGDWSYMGRDFIICSFDSTNK